MRYIHTTTAWLLIFSCVCNLASATSTQATKSGNFNDPGIWNNGLPGYALNQHDSIIIPTGITVTSSSNITGTSQNTALIINGNLTLANTASLILTNTKIIGSGDIRADSFVYTPVNYTDTLLFSGNINCGTFWMKGKATINSGANITTDSIRISHSLEVIASTITLNLHGQIHVHRDTGTTDIPLSTSSGTVNLPAKYKLKYTGDSVVIGDEIGVWNKNKIELEIDPGNGKRVHLPDSILVCLYNTLQLTSGILDATNTKLCFYENTSIKGNGEIDVNNGGIEIQSDLQNFGTLNLINGDKMSVLFLYMYQNPQCNITLGTDISVMQLDLSGGILNTNGHNITIRHANSISVPGIIHYGAYGNYINLSGGGSITKYLYWNTAVLNYWYHIYCPIGTDDGCYKLDIINNRQLDTPIAITIRATNEVLDATGPIHNTHPVVKNTWDIQTTAKPADSLDISIRAYWYDSNEVNNFDRNSCYLSNYDGNSWTRQPKEKAKKEICYTPLGLCVYSVEREHINQVGKFAILDSRYLSTKQISSTQNKSLVAYPNPAQDVLYFKNVSDEAEVKVYNAFGQLVLQRKLDKNRLDVSILPAGSYFLMLINKDVYEHTRFIKE